MIIAKNDLQALMFDIEPSVEEKMAIRRDTIWRHSRGEKSVVCKHWLRGLCKKNDECEFLHEYDLSKMPPCHFYINFGKCSNPDCLFLHLKNEERVKDCPWYNRGFCKHGPNCRNRHVRKQACGKYLAGFCPDGPNCLLGHPKYELPEEIDDDEEDERDRAMRGMDRPIPMVDEEDQDEVQHAKLQMLLDGDEMMSQENRTTAKQRSYRYRSPLICGKCGNGGHSSAYCNTKPIPDEKRKKKGLRPMAEVTCFKCGLVGHYANVCLNRRRPAPPGGYRLPGKLGQPDKVAKDRYAHFS